MKILEPNLRLGRPNLRLGRPNRRLGRPNLRLGSPIRRGRRGRQQKKAENLPKRPRKVRGLVVKTRRLKEDPYPRLALTLALAPPAPLAHLLPIQR